MRNHHTRPLLLIALLSIALHGCGDDPQENEDQNTATTNSGSNQGNPDMSSNSQNMSNTQPDMGTSGEEMGSAVANFDDPFEPQNVFAYRIRLQRPGEEEVILAEDVNTNFETTLSAYSSEGGLVISMLMPTRRVFSGGDWSRGPRLRIYLGKATAAPPVQYDDLSQAVELTINSFSEFTDEEVDPGAVGVEYAFVRSSGTRPKNAIPQTFGYVTGGSLQIDNCPTEVVEDFKEPTVEASENNTIRGSLRGATFADDEGELIATVDLDFSVGMRTIAEMHWCGD